MVFLHGGAWRGGEARAQAYAAETFVGAGAHWVVPDFATVMDVGLDGMVAQVRRAVAWVATHAASFGGDSGADLRRAATPPAATWPATSW